MAGSLTSSLVFHLLSDLGDINGAVSLLWTCPLMLVFKILFYQILRDTKTGAKKQKKQKSFASWHKSLELQQQQAESRLKRDIGLWQITTKSMHAYIIKGRVCINIFQLLGLPFRC